MYIFYEVDNFAGFHICQKRTQIQCCCYEQMLLLLITNAFSRYSA